MGFGQEGFGWKYMCYSYRVEVVLAGGDLEDEWLTVIDGQLKANVGGVYSGIDVRVHVGFNLHTIDDFFFVWFMKVGKKISGSWLQLTIEVRSWIVWRA